MLREGDKRGFFRLLVNSDCKLTFNDHPDGPYSTDSICRDLSATGMSVELNEPIETGLTVRSQLESNNPSVPALSALGRVVRCTQESDGLYLVGIEFVEIN